MGILRLPRDLRWLFGSNFLWMFGTGLYHYTLPVYAAELGAGPAQVGALAAVGFLAATISLLPSGYIAERFERRAALLASWSIGSLVGPVFFLADRWEWLMVGELFGWGSMFAITVLQAYTLRADSTGRPAYTLSLVFSSIPLGTVVSPTVGGQIAAIWGPRNVFLASTLLYAASTLMLLPISKQWPPAVPGGPRFCRRASSRGELREVLLGWAGAPRNLRWLALLLGFGDMILSLTVALGQVYVAEVAGAGYGRLGGLGSLASLGAAALGPVLGRVADRYSHQPALQVAGLLMVAYAAILVAAPRAWAAVGIAFFLRGAMEGTRALRAAATAGYAGPAEVGRALSFANISWGVFSTVGSYLGGWIYQVNRTWPLWLTIMGSLLYVGLLQRALRGACSAGDPGAAPRPRTPGPTTEP